MKTLTFAAMAAVALLPVLQLHAQSSSARPAITGVSHISVYTTDAAKSESFYVHDLGGVKRTDPENTSGVRYYFSSIQFVEVLPLPAGDTSINRLDHVAFTTANADKLKQYLSAHGVTVPSEVEKGSDGSRWFNVEDPEGNKIQFLQPPAKPEAVAANPLSNHIIHVGFIVHNPATEDVFFRALLGFRPYWHGGRTDTSTEWISQQVPDGTDWLEYMTVKGPETKGIPADMSKDTLGVLNHFSLGVFNMEKTVNLLYAGDRLTAKHSPPQIGRDGKWQLNLYDPDGTRAEVMEFQPAVKPCCSEFTAASPTK
ncbi:catechol 2,3-dioxygenase-like lactoylglutathione lyase family enzyme [Silvibacterium bohemicum]|uniref:Catechol 2,3-dioxygenase-like lactoylglutathione lyase family enzyme n=1 Tax=Silvibacterium bohemicum TaxID=1577686 RepID=A0A841K3K5_9BACT|nr:VOC family protein [Silvibacterium bohemicum]MBB6145218.1 catechol 2,3-dioxygenase-like lactoylglutathione lyase family enzyme [Silvibacterium bohemicum]